MQNQVIQNQVMQNHAIHSWPMQNSDTAIAVFMTHEEAELAVKQLFQSGFDMKNLSIIGKGFHTEEKVTGFYNIGDRMKFWGVNGAFWGGLWGLFFGGVILTLPVVGHVIVLGYLAATLVSAVEGAVLVGGISALGAALFSIGIPKDSIVQYEADIKADGFLVMAHLAKDEMARAKAILGATEPTSLTIYSYNEIEAPKTMNMLAASA
jgi:hypothetical protein